MAGATNGLVSDASAPFTSGGGSLSVTDGSSTVSGVTGITFSGATVSGTSPNATVTVSGGSVSATAYSVLGNNTSSTATASSLQTVTLGTPSITDTGVALQSTSSISGYWQGILQNTSNNAAASTDIIINNDQGTASTYYGDFGINSSTFSGTGSLALANATYLYSQSGDLVLGTNTSNAIHFVINNGATDALTIATTGASTFNKEVTIASGTITTSTPALNITQTWNNSGTTFDAPIFVNVTNSASNAASKLIDLQVGGTSQFNVNESGVITGVGTGLTGTAASLTAGTVTTNFNRINSLLGSKYGGSRKRHSLPVCKVCFQRYDQYFASSANDFGHDHGGY